jgi:hypothetical protein
VNSVFYGVRTSGMIAGCNHTGTPETPTASPAFGQPQRSRVSSVARRPASLTCVGGKTDCMRSLPGHAGLPRGGEFSRRGQDVRHVKQKTVDWLADNNTPAPHDSWRIGDWSGSLRIETYFFC